MANPVTSPSVNTLVDLNSPSTSIPSDLISVITNKFQGAMSAKESTLNLQKETLQTIVDDMNLMSDKLDALKDISNWDNVKPFKYPYTDLIGKPLTDNAIINKADELFSVNQQLLSAGFPLESPNVFFTSYVENSVTNSKIFKDAPPKTPYSYASGNLAKDYPNDAFFYYDDQPDPNNPGSFLPPTYVVTKNGVVHEVDFKPFRVPITQKELIDWNNFTSTKVLPNPSTYPFGDLIDLPVTDSKVKGKLEDLIKANSELKSAGMSLGPANIFFASYLQDNQKIIVAFDEQPKIVDSDFRLIEDGFYAVEKVPSSGIYSYKFVKDTLIYNATYSEVRVPTSKDELTAWNNFNTYQKSSNSSNAIFNDSVLLGSKNVNANINVNFNMAFVKQVNITSSPYTYSITAVSPENKSSQPKGTFFYLTDDIKNPKTYYLSSGSGAPSIVPTADISLFIINPSDNEIQSWRSQYAEKQIQLTQRSSEFQAFLNTTTAEFNTYSDLFTNVLKTIFSSLKDIVSKF